MITDFRELVIASLADGEAELLERLVVERELRCVAVHQLADLTRKLDRFRAQHQQLREEYQKFRARVMNEAIAA